MIPLSYLKNNKKKKEFFRKGKKLFFNLTENYLLIKWYWQKEYTLRKMYYLCQFHFTYLKKTLKKSPFFELWHQIKLKIPNNSKKNHIIRNINNSLYSPGSAKINFF